MKPMLAFRFNDKKRHVHYPCYIQPKIDGIRMLYRGGSCQSRGEKLWHDNILAHITAELEDFPKNIILDGELYVHGWPLQRINDAIAVKSKTVDVDALSVGYHIFDCIFTEELNLPFAERWPKLCDQFHFRSQQHTHLVATHEVLSEADAETYFRLFKELNYEGMMYRNRDAAYGLATNCTNKENRWNCLLKRKDWLDDEFKIVDVTVGEGQFSNAVGSLVCERSNGVRFEVGSGLSIAQRHRYMDKPPIGMLVTVKFETYSVDGKPLKPTVKLVHEA